MSFRSTKQAVAGEIRRTGANPSAAFRTLQLRQAALLADLALDHALFGPGADPVEAPARWMLPPTLEPRHD